MKQIVHNPSEGIDPATPDYVHAIEVREPSRWLYIAGTMGLDSDGSAPDTLDAQLELIWRNIRRILAEADMTVGNTRHQLPKGRLLRGGQRCGARKGIGRAPGSDDRSRRVDTQSRLAGGDRGHRRGLTIARANGRRRRTRISAGRRAGRQRRPAPAASAVYTAA